MKATAPIREILVLHHSHTDIGYTHPPVMVWELNRRFIDEAIDLCETTARWPGESRVRWTCETTFPLLHWLEHATPRRIDRFRRLVRAGQMGAGAVGLNLTPLCDAATLAGYLEPIRFLRKELGLPLKVAINHDVNGLPWPFADLLLDAGVGMLLMGINVHLGGFPLSRPRAFHWETPAGRRLTAFNAEHYQSFDRVTRILENSTAAMAEGIAAYLDRLARDGYPYDFVYLSATHPTYPDNNPPHPLAADLIRRWNREGRAPRIRFALPEDILARLAAQPAASLPAHAGDWTDFWNFGSASSAVETKVNRHAAHRLASAGLLRALTATATPRTPRPMWDDAWRSMLLYNEHTWCTHASLRKTPPEPANEQRCQKAISAYRARSLAGIAFRDTIEQWAGPAAPGDEAAGVMLCNPGPVEIAGCVRIPEKIFQPEWRFLCNQVLQIEARRDFDTPPDDPAPLDCFSAPAPTILAGPFTLPPFGYRYLGKKELLAARAAEPAGAEHAGAAGTGSAPAAAAPAGGAATTPAPAAPAAASTAAAAGTVRTAAAASAARTAAAVAAPAAVASNGLSAAAARIESPWFRLDYDSATGRILALHDKTRDAGLLDPASPWSFFGYVREMPDPAVHPHHTAEQGREAFFSADWARIHAGQSAWNAGWTARREPPARLLDARAAPTPEGASLILRWEAPGVRDFGQKITLDAALPRVICTATFNKEDERAAEALYFTFPLALRDWTAHYDTAGVPVEFDREQLPGSCRGWITADTHVCLHDAAGAITLACPDAPLFQIGGFNFARGNLPPDRRAAPLLLAWPMNNYWGTNFPATQPGCAQFRYVLASHPAYDPARSAAAARQARAEIEWQPVSRAPARRRGRFAEVRGDGVLLTSAGWGRKNTPVLHLQNVRPQPVAATVRLSGLKIAAAHRVGPAGHRLGPLPVRHGALSATLPPRSLTMVAVTLETAARPAASP
ncbi:MAG: hypothetical protein LBC18_15155 [Opitutaceae bacterium]|jgi:hypothetical protein|nr:hypothetical protein [Opitutaceae bacterium]